MLMKTRTHGYHVLDENFKLSNNSAMSAQTKNKLIH